MLKRRCDRAGAKLLSVGCTPGYADCQPTKRRPADAGFGSARADVGLVEPAVSVAQGALPTLYAATAPEVRGGNYIGPKLLGRGRGYPAIIRCSPRARDLQIASRLWEMSERLTGVHYAI